LQAAESITKVAAVISQAQIEQHYIPLLKRLSQGEWFTSRTSSAALYPAVYAKVSPAIQDDLRKGFTSLGSDDTPMVRRAAAKWLGVCDLLQRYLQCVEQSTPATVNTFLPTTHHLRWIANLS
jgi:hypothetical protein